MSKVGKVSGASLSRSLKRMVDITVPTVTDRDAIKTYRRRWGMVVAVYDDGDNDGLYRLIKKGDDLSSNKNWEKLPEGEEGSEYWHNINSAGRLWGGIITDNEDGTVHVSEGGGLIKEDEADIQDKPTATDEGQGSRLDYVEWEDVPSIPIADKTYTYLYYSEDDDDDDSGGTIKATDDFYDVSFTREFTVGRVFRDGSNVLIRLCGTNAWNFNRRVQLFGEEVFPVIRAWGLNMSDETNRRFLVSDGMMYAEMVNRFPIPEKPAMTEFTYWYLNDGTWESEKTTQISNIHYNNIAQGKALFGNPPNRWRADFVFVDHAGGVHVIMGQAEASSRVEAESFHVPGTLPGVVASYGSIIGRIVIQKNESELHISSAFEQVFTFSGVIEHNQLSGLQGGEAPDTYHHLPKATADKQVPMWVEDEEDPDEWKSVDTTEVDTVGTTEVDTVGTTEVDTVGTTEVDTVGTTEVDTVGTTEVDTVGTTEVDTVGTTEVDTVGTTEVDTVGTTEVDTVGTTEVDTVGTTEVDTVGTTEVDTVGTTEVDTVGTTEVDTVGTTEVDTVELGGSLKVKEIEGNGGHKIQLKNDEDEPGVNKAYKTNNLGVKGWWDDTSPEAWGNIHTGHGSYSEDDYSRTEIVPTNLSDGRYVVDVKMQLWGVSTGVGTPRYVQAYREMRFTLFVPSELTNYAFSDLVISHESGFYCRPDGAWVNILPPQSILFYLENYDGKTHLLGRNMVIHETALTNNFPFYYDFQTTYRRIQIV